MLFGKCCLNLSKQSQGQTLVVQISKLRLWLSQFHKVFHSLGLSKRILFVISAADILHLSK